VNSKLARGIPHILLVEQFRGMKGVGRRQREMVRFLVWIFLVLTFVHLVQLAVVSTFGLQVHNAIFLLERDHWMRMWTPFTSAVAHAHIGHLGNNLAGFVVYGTPVAAILGARWTITALYAGAVLAQLMGIASGKGDLMGASGGVMAAASIAIVTAPLWISNASAWSRPQAVKITVYLRARRYARACWGYVVTLSLFSYVLFLGLRVGLQLASDFRGVTLFASYEWGGAPAGPGYSAHLFGFAFGAAVGLVILAAALHRHATAATVRDAAVARNKPIKPPFSAGPSNASVRFPYKN
jgi:membrane associated rhomboid family serine protease